MAIYKQRRFIVVDEDDNAIRTFLSKREAQWYIQLRPEFKIVELPMRSVNVDLINLVGEAPF